MMTSCDNTNPLIISLKHYAKQGDPIAQNELGSCYYKGNYVEKDYYEAIRWFRAASNQGMPMAQHNMGVCYATGNGFPQNFKQAVAYFKLAAEQGFAPSEYCLACALFDGVGTTRDIPTAISWFKKAAEHNSLEAMNELGNIYLNGKMGLDFDTTYAYQWIKQAAYHGYAESQYQLGLFYKDGIMVKKDMSLAIQWIKKAANQSFTSAQYELGTYYHHGIGVEQDFNKANYWYDIYALNQRAVLLTYPGKRDELHFVDSLYQGGFDLLFGIENPQDQKKAITCLKASSESGNPLAKTLLAYCYATAFGVHLNKNAAVQLFVGKGEIRYKNNEGSYCIRFEIYKDGSFNKTIQFQNQNSLL